MTDWFEGEIYAGLLQLEGLMLERSPAAADLRMVTATWVASLTFELAWCEERDVERIRGAFARLGREANRWPSPREFLIALPMSTQKRLPKPERNREPTEHAKACMGEIAEMFAEDKARGWAHTEPLAAAIGPVLRETRGPSHYRDARAAAAGEEVTEREVLQAGDDPDLPAWLQERNDPPPREEVT